MTQPSLPEHLAIVGSGAIARGLAATAAPAGPVTLWARSGDSAQRAARDLARLCPDGAEANVRVVTEWDALGEATFVVEAVVENHDTKVELLTGIVPHVAPEAIIASTTSSLSIESLARASGRPERFAGLHVFNPVTKMKLVELAFPAASLPDTRRRAHALCQALGKTAVEVPDVTGFVVNRLLFPYLFSAVRLLEETDMDAADVDSCMTLGAGHPMGPLALLDLIGLDVAQAIGEALQAPVPDRLQDLLAEGALGRKSGRGFHAYRPR